MRGKTERCDWRWHSSFLCSSHTHIAFGMPGHLQMREGLHFQLSELPKTSKTNDTFRLRPCREQDSYLGCYSSCDGPVVPPSHLPFPWLSCCSLLTTLVVKCFPGHVFCPAFVHFSGNGYSLIWSPEPVRMTWLFSSWASLSNPFLQTIIRDPHFSNPNPNNLVHKEIRE